ncbi:MAG: response regulator [Acidobacteriota bacterium]
MEDSASDVFLIRNALRVAQIQAELHIVTDGQKAARFFDEADDSDEAFCPALVILDINLPKMNGDEVLKHIRKSAKCGAVPVLIVSSSDSDWDRKRMLKLGCDGYFRKPSEYENFLKLGELVRGLLAGESV